jgi:hypothetical protein
MSELLFRSETCNTAPDSRAAEMWLPLGANSQAFCSQRRDQEFNAAISGDWWSQELGNARSGTPLPADNHCPHRFQAARRRNSGRNSDGGRPFAG